MALYAPHFCLYGLFPARAGFPSLLLSIAEETAGRDNALIYGRCSHSVFVLAMRFALYMLINLLWFEYCFNRHIIAFMVFVSNEIFRIIICIKEEIITNVRKNIINQ